MSAAEAARPGEQEEDLDLVRATIWFLGILLVGLLVVVWALERRAESFQKAVEAAKEAGPKMAHDFDQVRKLLARYKEGGAGQARFATQTWMAERYGNARIGDAQVGIEQWRNRPTKEYVENYLKVNVKGITREQALHFVWNVERVSTIMRTIDLKLSRAGGRDEPEADKWDMVVTFGYRVPPGFAEGG